MNWRRFIFTGSIALTLVAVPAATAQLATRGTAAPRGGVARANVANSGARSFQAPIARGGGRIETGRTGGFRNGAGRGGHWRGGDRGRWGHRRWHGRGVYPYYAYYPYGYPFWGSSFYFSTYRPVYYARSSGSLVVDVQSVLARAGYYDGAIDGIIGPATRRAIRLYERASGLPVDGRIDEALLAVMGLR